MNFPKGSSGSTPFASIPSRNQSHTPPMEPLEARQLLTTWSPQAIQVGIDQARQNYPAINGAGQTIVIIDDGSLDVANPLLQGSNGHKIIYTWNFNANNSNVFDQPWNPHATAVAGMAAGDPYYASGQLYEGIAPDANIIMLEASGDWNDTQALNWVASNKDAYHIVAVNWTDTTSPNPADFITPLLTLKNDNIFVGRPVGNYPGLASAVPGNAYYQSSSVEPDGSVNSSLPTGPNVNMFAPGNVLVPWYSTTTGSTLIQSDGHTSWASPQTVATAALILQVNPSFTPDQCMQIMRDSANWVYDPISNSSIPELNVNAAIALAYQRSGQAPTQSVPTPVATPTATVPNGPFGLVANVSGGSVQLAFYDNSDNESGFVVSRSSTPSGPYTQIALLPAASGTGSVVTYTDAAPGSGTWYYQVYATNGQYHSSSVWASAVVGGAVASVSSGAVNSGGVPNGPFNLVTAVNGNSVTLQFVDNAWNESGFVVERAASASGPYAQIATLPASSGTLGTVSYTDSSIPVTGTFYYRVYAVNGSYASSVATASATVSVGGAGSYSGVVNPGSSPNAPYNFGAWGSAGNVSLAFVDNAGNETAFVIDRSTNPAGPFTVVATLPPSAGVGQTVTYVDSTATSGNTYYYRAYAVNGPYQSGIARTWIAV